MNAREYLEGHWLKKHVWTRLELPVHQERLRRCAEAVKGGRTFIDVGCALGHSTAILKRFCPGDWTGIDFYGPATERAKKLFPDIKFLSASDFNLLPICGTFDGVVCSEVIEHVENDGALVAGLASITGRQLVVTTPSRKVHDPGHLRVYTQAGLAELFKDMSGVRIDRTKRFFYLIAEGD